MKKPPTKQGAARKHGAGESTELFQVAVKAVGQPKPKINKKVMKLAKALRKDDPTS